MALLDITDLRAGYSAGEVLRGVSLSLEAGEVVAILGANGAGKSTLLKAIMGLQPARSGVVRFDGEEITGWSTAARVRRGLALAPEGREVFASLTVEENLVLGHYARFRRRRAARAGLDGVFAIFPRLRERRRQLGGDLSGGEQQMLALGRALMAEPRCLLIDELSLGLAPAIVREIYERLRVAAGARQLALCVVEQNTEMALHVAGWAHVLSGGEIVLSGPSGELVADGQLAEAYLRAGGVRSPLPE